MQEIREVRGNREIIDRLVGLESESLKEEFERRRKELVARIESGETESATIKEAHRISYDDVCPCGSGMKFKRCCGKRLAADDSRISP